VWNEKGNILLMLKLYSALLLLLSSCATKISYIGSKGTPVTTTDVYVSEQSIHKPYEVIGRGFVKQGRFNRRYEEVMQRKSLKKAKEVGADAVLFLDFAVLHPPRTITSITRTDSILNSRLSTNQITLGPTTTYGFTILFLKYKSVK
jgi:hypothetical protein